MEWLRIDEVVQLVQDFMTFLVSIYYEQDESKKVCKGMIDVMEYFLGSYTVVYNVASTMNRTNLRRFVKE